MLKSDEPTVAAELEKLGSNEVRSRLARGEYGDIGSVLHLFVQRWLSSDDAKKKFASAARSESREEESLWIARDANSLSRKALFNSRMANVIAIIAMVLSIIVAIIK